MKLGCQYISYARYFIDELMQFLLYLTHTVCGIPEENKRVETSCKQLTRILKEKASIVVKHFSLEEDEVYMFAIALQVFMHSSTLDRNLDVPRSRVYAQALLQYGTDIIESIVQSFKNAVPQYQEVVKEYCVHYVIVI